MPDRLLLYLGEYLLVQICKSEHIVWSGWYSRAETFVSNTVARSEYIGKCRTPFTNASMTRIYHGSRLCHTRQGYTYGLVQDCSNSNTIAMELMLLTESKGNDGCQSLPVVLQYHQNCEEIWYKIFTFRWCQYSVFVQHCLLNFRLHDVYVPRMVQT